MTTLVGVFCLTVFVVLTPFSKCAVFENVTVSLTSQWEKLFYYGQPPKDSVFIESSDSLGDYVNFQPLEIVVITQENIPELKENSVANLPNIFSVYITSSGIKKIEPGAFGNVPKLDYLNLGENRLEEIEDGVFSNLLLKVLYLNNNKISKLGPAAFNNMTLLSVIVLSNNKISMWSGDWFFGTPVLNVYMGNNLVEELPADVFSYLFPFKRANVALNIENFIFANNGLKKVNEDAFRHVNGFGVISLSNNSLENLPTSVFHSVKNVNVLHLTNNQISNVEGLFDDININDLFLDDNRLSCFPTDIFDVSKIGRVHVLRNSFTCACVEHWKNWQKRNQVSVIHLKHLEKKCLNKI